MTKRKSKKKEFLGRGKYKIVYLTKDNNNYVAIGDGYLDCTNDNKLKYIIKCIDPKRNIIELGIHYDINYDNVLDRYYSQMIYSAFELTYMNVGTPDGVQSVLTKDNYRYKRIDYTWQRLFECDIYNQYRLLMYNLYIIIFPEIINLKTKNNIIGHVKPLTEKYNTNTLEIIHNFFNFLCNHYNINLEDISLDNTLYISKDVYIKNSMFYMEPYIKFSELNKLGNSQSVVDELEVSWVEFDYVFNQLRPIYGGIMNYLEENIYNKNTYFINKVNKQFRQIIHDTSIV